MYNQRDSSVTLTKKFKKKLQQHKDVTRRSDEIKCNDVLTIPREIYFSGSAVFKNISRFFSPLLHKFYTIAFRKKATVGLRPQHSRKPWESNFFTEAFLSFVGVEAFLFLFSHEFKRQETAKKSILVISKSK